MTDVTALVAELRANLRSGFAIEPLADADITALLDALEQAQKERDEARLELANADEDFDGVIAIAEGFDICGSETGTEAASGMQRMIEEARDRIATLEAAITEWGEACEDARAASLPTRPTRTPESNLAVERKLKATDALKAESRRIRAAMRGVEGK